MITPLVDYDTAVDWPARLEREGPFLLRVLAEIGDRRVIDLGSSTGELARWLAAQGFAVVGIEGVKERWEVAQRGALPQVQHLLGDLGAVEAMVRGRFGAALCLGNSLAAVLGVEALSRMFIGLRRRLHPGSPFVAHQLNYDRLFRQGVRSLPDRRLPDGDGELLFRRELELREDGVIGITESVLHRPRGEEGPGELRHRRHLFQQGWRHEELLALLDIAQFRKIEVFGGFSEEPFDPEQSSELVLVAH